MTQYYLACGGGTPMTPTPPDPATASGPERIFLQPDCCVDPSTGRLWCEDNVWPDCEDSATCGKTGVEYVLVTRATPALDDEIVAVLDGLIAIADPITRKEADLTEQAEHLLTRLKDRSK